MSFPAVLAVAFLLATFMLLWDRERRGYDIEHELRLDEEARADAFEALFLEEAREKL